ncbi:hypothetical protein [Natrinema sp. DC36]|uniref:hypothetical protein n=1 Tax=Natrinema sp. DC36 TaxID=2878680 RepID=UPI001CEFBEC9|nr:hypothetical protein [Natrinema sp. DC36]
MDGFNGGLMQAARSMATEACKSVVVEARCSLESHPSTDELVTSSIHVMLTHVMERVNQTVIGR